MGNLKPRKTPRIAPNARSIRPRDLQNLQTSKNLKIELSKILLFAMPLLKPRKTLKVTSDAASLRPREPT